MANSALPIGRSGPPLLRVVTPQGLTESIRQQQEAAAPKPAAEDQTVMDELARYIRGEWDIMRNHRNGNSGWSERLLHAQRVFNGEYDQEQKQAIAQFGGSQVYARVIALKCRGASAMLREVYMGPEKAWGLEPTPEPTLPDDVVGEVSKLVDLEMQNMQAMGAMPDLNAIRDRTNGLIAAAKLASKKNARKEAKHAESKLDDRLVEGGFYDALSEMLIDLPLFPFACIKGPVIRIVADVVWAKGKPITQNKAKMFWNRVSPFDVYWTPGAATIRDASVIEKQRLTRADLNDLIGLPGYNEENIRAILDEHGRGGLRDWADTTDSERAQAESRENPTMNRSGMIDCLEYHGNIQGRMLLEHGFGEDQITDADRDYFVQAWLIGRYVIKVQISPNPRKRHPYYITSFEKVPGTPVGNALPDILKDIQDVCNATLRSLVNNLSIASGPQVVVDEDRLSPLEDGNELYPWKRWRVKSDPMMNQNSAQKPIDFFSPQSHAQELLGVYKEFTNIADELSAIPRYITGGGAQGGAGRTASGLAMLMGNASKILQMVASNVDNDIMRPALQGLYDIEMLTSSESTFRGDESIRVRGVEVAMQRETARQRQIELLQATANPLDAQILGLPGRAKLLRAVSNNVGLDGEDLVPDEESMMAQAGGAGVPGAPPPPEPGEGERGASPAPAPAHTNLGVQEGQVTQGMAGGPQRFAEGGVVEPMNGEVMPPAPVTPGGNGLEQAMQSLLQATMATHQKIDQLAALIAAPTEVVRDPATGKVLRAQKVQQGITP